MSTPYTLATTSNRLASVGGIARSYDFSGNQTGDGASAFTYDDRGRLVGVTTPLGSVTYAVNALGQRVRKTAGAITTYFAYDLSGRLIGEYDGTGAPIQEVSWLGDTPVATMRPNGTGFDIFPIWTDHLNTPRMVTNMAGQVRWEWANADPFGANAANDNPAGLGAFAFNLRFPGQYYDAETGLHYNYFRDYDPVIGRYVQSDPIGLKGGINTYGYVKGQPLIAVDPLGLYNYYPPMPGMNTVMCDGKGDDPIPQLDNMNGALNRQCLGPCVQAHEMNHINDLLKIGKAPCRGKPKGTIVTFDTPGQLGRSELDSYNVEIDCLFKLIGSASSCACNTIIEKRIKQLFNERKRYE